MSQTLVIYDNEGYILSVRQGVPAPREPQGVPFLWVTVPSGKRIKMSNGAGVDVSVTPHQVILEDIPLSELEELKQTVADLTEIVLLGGHEE